jgi:hypothetical protein
MKIDTIKEEMSLRPYHPEHARSRLISEEEMIQDMENLRKKNETEMQTKWKANPAE